MKRPALIILIFCIVMTACLSEALNLRSTTYYLDADNGDDSFSGTSPDQAWKTFKNASNRHYIAGDKILLRGLFYGSLVIESVNGTSDHPIVISGFNERALIMSGDDLAIRVENSSYVEVKNLIATGSGRKEGNNSNGIEFDNVFFGSIDSVDVSGYLYSGIKIMDGGDISITHVYAHTNGFSGILVTQGDYDATPAKPIRNIYIGYCVAENNPGCPAITDNHSGNGILMTGVTNGIIEYCRAMYNGWDMPRKGNGPVGIWAAKCDSIIIQHCYSHNNMTSPEGDDGGGFDFDGGVTNSIMQYNLSAYNMGAGYGMYQYKEALPWDNNILRYNISYLDGRKNGRSGIHMWVHPQNPHLPISNFAAYNNTVVNDAAYAINFEPGIYKNFTFENNLLYLVGDANQFIGGTFAGPAFNNNLYWSEKTSDKTKPPFRVRVDKNMITQDPRMILPDSDLEIETVGMLKTMQYFKLREGSAAKRSGTIINEPGNSDFWGNPLDPGTKPNIGAYGGK